MELLKFGKGNAKLDGSIATFSLPAGYSCPGANECLSRANKQTGKIKDGPETRFRCFSASQESLFRNVREARWNNLRLLKKAKTDIGMQTLIEASIPQKATKIRIHVAGDFFSQDYFDAWMYAANHFPEKIFYFYTKSIPFWLARLKFVGDGFKPGKVKNIVPTFSLGGKFDAVGTENQLRFAKVVFSEQEANTLNLPIDHDDSHAYVHGPSFGLLIHGIQPAGSEAGKAKSALKGNGSYSRRQPLQLVEGV